VAGQLIGQFAENLRRDIAENQPAAPAAAAAPSPAPAVAPAPAAAATPIPAAAPAPAMPPRPSPAPAPAAKELSAFSLVWGALKSIVAGWFRNLFGGKRAG
jgi:hypothetical protein